MGRGLADRDLTRRPQAPPVWPRLVAVSADMVVRRLFPCVVAGMEHYTGAPATLAVSNHRRDSDGPLLGSVLLRRYGKRTPDRLPHFVAREDLFERGFLAHYLTRCPAALRPLLGMIDLRHLLAGAGVYPLQRVHERSVAGVLQNVIAQVGDLPAADALRPRPLAALAAELGFDPASITVTQLLRRHGYRLRGRSYGYRQLRLALFRRLAPHLRATIDRQLEQLSRLLERGELIILEPEGRLSRDGSLRRPQAVLHELVNRPQRPVRVLPVAVTYDSLTTGAARILVDVRPELTGLEGLSRRALDERVTAAIRSGCRVTGAQLAAGFLRRWSNPDDVWTEAALIEHVHAAARRCRDAAIRLDPCLLQRAACERRIQDLLGWGLRTRFLSAEGPGRWRTVAPAAPPPWLPQGPSTLLDYLRTELLEAVGAARARDLDLLP